MAKSNAHRCDSKKINEENRFFGEVVERMLNTPPQPKVKEKKTQKPYKK